MRHYHVIENTPGYLPDAEPATFTNRRQAVSYAVSLMRELREEGYQCNGRDGDYYCYCERDRSDLGRMIETTPCDEGHGTQIG